MLDNLLLLQLLKGAHFLLLLLQPLPLLILLPLTHRLQHRPLLLQFLLQLTPFLHPLDNLLPLGFALFLGQVGLRLLLADHLTLGLLVHLVVFVNLFAQQLHLLVVTVLFNSRQLLLYVLLTRDLDIAPL
jgi:hypothetical protein